MVFRCFSILKSASMTLCPFSSKGKRSFFYSWSRSFLGGAGRFIQCVTVHGLILLSHLHLRTVFPRIAATSHSSGRTPPPFPVALVMQKNSNPSSSSDGISSSTDIHSFCGVRVGNVCAHSKTDSTPFRKRGSAIFSSQCSLPRLSGYFISWPRSICLAIFLHLQSVPSERSIFN